MCLPAPQRDLRPELRAGNARHPLLHRLPQAERPSLRGGRRRRDRPREGGGLLACEAKVTLLAPDAIEPLEELAAEGSIRWERREYAGAADLEGVFMVIAATDGTDVNIAVYDDTSLGRCWSTSSTCRHSTSSPGHRASRPLAIAISTAGASPASQAHPGQIAEEYGEPYARLAVLLNDVRGWAGHPAHLPAPQGLLRVDRQRRSRPGRAAPRGDEAAVRDLIAAAQRARACLTSSHLDEPEADGRRGRSPTSGARRPAVSMALKPPCGTRRRPKGTCWHRPAGGHPGREAHSRADPAVPSPPMSVDVSMNRRARGAWGQGRGRDRADRGRDGGADRGLGRARCTTWSRARARRGSPRACCSRSGRRHDWRR